MNNKANLLRKYADMHDMCEGTDVEAYQCVKCEGSLRDGFKSLEKDSVAITDFAGHNGWSYQFALCIIENHPVFVGDILYGHNGNEYEVIENGWVKDIKTSGWFNILDKLSWKQPKQPIAKVEGKDVFVGDVIYNTAFKRLVKIIGVYSDGNLNCSFIDKEFITCGVSVSSALLSEPTKNTAASKTKPITKGDKVYSKFHERTITVSSILSNGLIVGYDANGRELTVHRDDVVRVDDKKNSDVITINGKVLPAPVEGGEYVINMKRYGWKTWQEREEFEKFLFEFLENKQENSICGYGISDSVAIVTKDPYAELKQAQKDGKMIRFTYPCGRCIISGSFGFNYPLECYEILK